MININRCSKIIFLFMFILMVNIAYAEKVTIFNFNYDHGKISLKEQFIKEGYYPDRKIQVEEGYNCNLVDKNNNNLYGFKFELPIKLYTDISINQKINGNVIILNETDFSFVMPYLLSATRLRCFNPQGYKIIDEDIEKIKLSPEKKGIWIWIYLIFALIGFIILIYFKKKNI